MTRRPRLLLADEHPLFLEGVRRLLEKTYDVVGTVADLAAAQAIRKTVPSAKFIVLSVHSDQAYVSEAFRVGVRGYVSKRAAAAELLTGIKQVL